MPQPFLPTDRILHNNQVFADKLSSALIGIPRRILGAAAATALNAVIEKTKHDSSRAGANWDLKIGDGMIPTAWDPAKYNQPMTRDGQMSSPIGEKFDAGKYKQMVKDYKAAFYGYALDSSGVMMPTAGGRLAKLLDIPDPNAGLLTRSFKGVSHFISKTPTVVVFNPIYSQRWQPYAFNAFRASFTKDHLIKLNNSIPMVIKYHLNSVLRAHGSGKI